MTNVLIIGDGPGGLSAALFLAKNKMDVQVFGQDDTPMHHAMLYNYLGIPQMTGSEFQRIAREQVAQFGAKLHDEEVTAVEKTDEGFAVTTKDGAHHHGKYVVIAEGKGLKLAQSLGLPKTAHGIEVDADGRTTIAGVYVVGRSTRSKSQPGHHFGRLGRGRGLGYLVHRNGQSSARLRYGAQRRKGVTGRRLVQLGVNTTAEIKPDSLWW